MIMKRKTTKRKSRSKRLPSWNEVRIGLSQVSKLRLLFLLAKIYRSSVVPKSVKSNILSMAKTGAKRVNYIRNQEAGTIQKSHCMHCKGSGEMSNRV